MLQFDSPMLDCQIFELKNDGSVKEFSHTVLVPTSQQQSLHQPSFEASVVTPMMKMLTSVTWPYFDFLFGTVIHLSRCLTPFFDRG
eukprot:Em0010g617a